MTSRSKLATSMLNQTAVYWANPTADGFGGRTFDNPVAISVRWERRQQLIIDQAGQEVTSTAIVYVGQDIELGGYLFLGTIADLSSTTENPQEVDDAREIRRYDKTPDVSGTRFTRTAWL